MHLSDLFDNFDIIYNLTQAFVFLREFVLGDNTTGLVTSSGVIGGENSTMLHGDVLLGQDVIFYGSGTTVSSMIAPTASMSAWLQFLQTATVAPSASATSGTTSDAIRTRSSLGLGMLVQGLVMILSGVAILWVKLV